MYDKQIWKTVAKKIIFILCYENKNKKQRTQPMVHHVSLMSAGILKYFRGIYHIIFIVLYS